MKYIFIACSAIVGLCSRTSLRAREVNSLISTGAASELNTKPKDVVPSRAATKNDTHTGPGTSPTGAAAKIEFSLQNDAKKALLAVERYIAALEPDGEKEERTTTQLAQGMAAAPVPGAAKRFFRPVSVTLRCVLA